MEALLYVVWKCIRTNMMKCAFISSLAILGFLLASYKIFIPMWLDTAMVASLFFYFGILISETNFLIKGTKSLYLVLGAVICYLIYIFFPVKISMSVNYYSNTYLTVVSGMAIVVFILLVCKLVNQILVINWIGRNSLVLLCTHHLVYRPIKYFLIHFGYDYPLLLFVLTIIVEIPIIFIINRYFPVLAGKGKLVVRS